MIFGFLFVGNSIGMIPFSTTITSNLTNTFFIAATVFVVVLSTMIIEKGITHLIGLFLPSGTPFGLIPLLVPIEVVSYSFRLVSLSVRLFANMLAGHTLMKVFSGFS
jgi:F-type H+-transporting ATPase subunit a